MADHCAILHLKVKAIIQANYFKIIDIQKELPYIFSVISNMMLVRAIQAKHALPSN